MTNLEKSIAYKTAGRAEAAQQWQAELAADAERGGKMPEIFIDLSALTTAKDEAVAEVAKQAEVISKEANATKKREAEQAKALAESKLADAESWERIAKGEPTEEDQAKLDALQADYAKNVAVMRALVAKLQQASKKSNSAAAINPAS